ncbi:MAG: hypothetical protein KC441_09800 [Anaerolineales bacterium]|nr:hypothetical protein [Anaerolineales bacterium]
MEKEDSGELHCENCGQSVLPTDTICWHCGWRLPTRPGDGAAALAVPEAAQPFSLTAVAAYAGLTALIILLLLVVFRALGSYPVILLDPKAPIKPGWQPVTDQRQTFTLEIPPGWLWMEDDLNGRLDKRLAASPPMIAALNPWSELVDDLVVRLMAEAADADAEQLPGFVLVAFSSQMAQVSPEQMTAVWTNRVTPEDLLSVAVQEDLRGQAKGTAVLAVQAANEPWVCRQEGVTGDDGRYLVVGCAPLEQYEEHAREYEILLSSFQLLQPPS